MKRILHVCPDEKFIDFAINSFNSVESAKSDFIVISQSNSLKYIKNENVTIKSKWAFLCTILFKGLKNYEAVVFHSMQELYKLFIKFIPSKVKVCWIGFGFDYYESSKLISVDTAQLSGETRNLKKVLLNLDAAYNKVDYFCPVLESEFLPVANRLKLNAKYVDWNYGSSNALIQKLKNDYVKGDSILLGNSADPTNNHIEILNRLIKNNESRELVIPLSYGGNKSYIDSITTLLNASQLNYTILSDFITQDDYFGLLKRCSFVIMAHKRQQAVGNIIMMLSLGAKVILDEASPVCNYLSRLGFVFFTTENLESALTQPLDYEVALMNKKIALKQFNDDVTKRNTENLVSILCDN